MYISELSIRNFRCFGGENPYIIRFNKGLNALVGENDSGKTAIIDALRIALGTTDQSWYHLEQTDFYNENENLEIEISIKFAELSTMEQAAFLECLTHEDHKPVLYLHYTFKYLQRYVPSRIYSTVSSGPKHDGAAPSSLARELIRATYLRPLRDAYTNMQSGRGSRLAQVLLGVEELNNGIQEYREGIELEKLSLTGLAELSNQLLSKNIQIQSANKKIGDTLSQKMLLVGDKVETSIQVSNTGLTEKAKLKSLLEKLDLKARTDHHAGKVGLGTSNIMSMACELLLNSSDEVSSFLLIEEPEAHIHVPRQMRLIRSLQEEAEDSAHQIILTTHSPVLASMINLKNISIVRNAKVFPLGADYTELRSGDYAYLERFLDSTKANMFFAKGVIIVEGPSEELLFPSIARLIGLDLTAYGITIVNTRGIGLNRFSKIFQRKTEPLLAVPVACVTDRDIAPDCAKTLGYVKEGHKSESDISDMDEYVRGIRSKSDGQFVKTFVSDHWTLEYDLAFSGLQEELVEATLRTWPEIEAARRNSKREELHNKMLKFENKKEQCAYLTHLISQRSKPTVAQELGIVLEEKYEGRKAELISKLPKYIVDAILYAVTGSVAADV